ncbi:MAG: hypothetical protein LBM66_07485, partial [Bifidobacteriaceae bacterium]|nr:hypothetical protein [Bifidobacteriaceae bacterium]
IDTTAPDAADVTAVAADGTLTLTAPDGVTLEYSPNGSVWAPYTGPVAITGVVYYRAIDAAGNASAPKFVEVPAQPVVVSVPGATKVVEVQVPQIVNTEKVVTVNAAALSKLASTRPVIKGKAKAGKTLKVKKGAWTAGAKLTVKWYVNGKKVTTASKFKVKHAYKGKRIVAKVTGSKSGYKTVTRASKTVKIKK